MKTQMKRVVAVALRLACLQLLAFVASAHAQNAPPKAPAREVTDDYFGMTIVDPYRWMEDVKAPEFAAWMRAQNDYTRSALDRIPYRAKLLARVNELSDASASITAVRRVNNSYFYYKLAPGENDRKLYVRDGLVGTERLLADPTKASTESKHYSLNYFFPSLDGHYVAYGISPSGSENAVIHIIEVATGREMIETINRVVAGFIFWLPDGKSFLYNRLQKLAPGAPPVQILANSRVYLHTLGANPDEDKPIFGNGAAQSPQIAETDIPIAGVFPNSSFVIGIVRHGVQNERTIYAAPLSDLAKETMAWRKVVDPTDEITNFDVRGDEIYLLSHKNASRFKVLRMSLAKPDVTRAEVVVPPSEAVITNLRAAKDALYVQLLDGGIGRLLRAPYGGKPEAVKAPYDGAISDLNTDVRQPGVVFALESWTKSPLWFAYDPATKRMADTQLRQPSPIDYSGVESVEVKVKSYDGTLVPLSIVYKKDLKRDGTNPTLLLGYGAYGISRDPRFSPTLLAWLERGGVFAVAHVRGGGEYGEEWHKAGYKATKMNTIRDFIACAEYLVNERYTSPKHLAGQGRSAGGILIGGAITQRPDLFAAAINNVGVSDNLRIETTPNGLLNIPEFGSVKTKEGFDALYAMSSYHHVKDGVAYPAVLLTTGLNDTNVASWQSAKMAARLQAATTGAAPILLRVDYDAGHGIGSTKQQLNEELADIYVFLFQQLGVR
jgi:prolyl oligopeptidase